MNEFIKPWESCPGCHQSYQNELRIDIATEFVSRLFEGSIQTIQKCRWRSLYLKLCALKTMLGEIDTRAKEGTEGTSANFATILN
jgi:hypothetical protein